MGWPSCLEDIRKRAEDLERTCDDIHAGRIAYVDGNREKVVDTARQIRRLVDNLEVDLRMLGPDDSKRLSEIRDARKALSTALSEKEWLSNELKKAQEQAHKLKEERDEEKKKLEFIHTTFRNGGISKLVSYLNRL